MDFFCVTPVKGEGGGKSVGLNGSDEYLRNNKNLFLSINKRKIQEISSSHLFHDTALYVVMYFFKRFTKLKFCKLFQYYPFDSLTRPGPVLGGCHGVVVRGATFRGAAFSENPVENAAENAAHRGKGVLKFWPARAPYWLELTLPKLIRYKIVSGDASLYLVR